MAIAWTQGTNAMTRTLATLALLFLLPLRQSLAQVPDTLGMMEGNNDPIVVRHDTVHVQLDQYGAPIAGISDLMDTSDSVKVRYQGALTGTYSAGAVERLLIVTSHSVTFTSSRLTFPMSVSYTLGSQDDKPRENEFHYITSPSYDVHKHWRIYNDVEYETSRLLGIESRFLLGGGPGYRTRGKSGNSLAVSNLILLESTYYDDMIIKRLVRNSTRVKFVLTWGQLTWASLTFVQPSLVTDNDLRFSTANTVSMKVYKNFSVAATANYRYESVVPVGRNNSNLLTTIGATVALE